ncbi:aldo/keto reductase [Ferroplasma sp.]|uniref:aldo/keto reductase n=1 Tax=Ferroplasma sp. TaxID=2591003 RepID=UPI00262BC4EB|nr:aldo/keto reductase [Ferroplasma sp.]MCL4453724.1 aldo/keto reductase [Candidatus Thermoplasmatota archaeon]
MKYVNLGNTGVKVSVIGIGTWHLPGSGRYNEQGIEYVDNETFARIFKKAYDSGINFYDTANIYHGRVEHNEDCIECTGNSEKILGKIIKNYERESLVISTKVRGPMAGYINSSGLSRKHIMSQIKESLNRLNTDYVDLYQFHWSDNEVPLIETLKTMSHIVDLDYSRYIGMSNVNATDISDFMHLSERYNLNFFSTIQEPYNILNRNIEDNKLIYARKYGLGLLAYTPLDQGILTGKYLQDYDKSSRITYYPELKKEIERTEIKVKPLKELADNKGVTLSQLSIAWLLKMSEKLGIRIIPLLGITKIQHLADNLEAINVSLKEEDMKYINEIYLNNA